MIESLFVSLESTMKKEISESNTKTQSSIKSERSTNSKRNSSELEHSFQKKVKKRLQNCEGVWHFTKEALSLRGLPDIIGCYRGRLFAWELKRDHKEASKQTGRIVLQRYILSQICKAGGIGRIVHPDNFEQCLQELLDQ